MFGTHAPPSPKAATTTKPGEATVDRRDHGPAIADKKARQATKKDAR